MNRIKLNRIAQMSEIESYEMIHRYIHYNTTRKNHILFKKQEDVEFFKCFEGCTF